MIKKLQTNDIVLGVYSKASNWVARCETFSSKLLVSPIPTEAVVETKIRMHSYYCQTQRNQPVQAEFISHVIPVFRETIIVTNQN